jgi:flagellar hook-associated protein 2
MSTSPIPSPTFSGVSTYSNDFQQVLSRAVAIASLPMQQMENQVMTLTGQENALSSLQSTFTSLQNAIQSLTSAGSAMSATVSDPSIVSASATSSALPGTYSIQVTNLGSATTTLSNAGATPVTDPTTQNISSSNSFTLTINGTATTITPSGNTLQDLASAINSSGLAVQATIVNVGSNSSPDYRLSIVSNNLAADSIQLNDGTNDLLSTLSTGAPATYQVDGINTNIQSNSRQVTLAPGLTVNLLQQSPGTWDTITVNQNIGGLSSDLQNFVAAYNSSVDALNAQHGQNAGALAGTSLINSLGQALHTISLYSSGSGSVSSLADLGLTLDQTGHLSFNPAQLSTANSAAIQQFLGSPTSGFLGNATSAINSAADNTSGLIQGNITSVQSQITSENKLIAQQQNQITNLQTSLQKQLSAADAAIAVLQQQVTMMADLFTAQYGANSNSSTTSSLPGG